MTTEARQKRLSDDEFHRSIADGALGVAADPIINEAIRARTREQELEAALVLAEVAIQHAINRPHEHNPSPSWIPTRCEVFDRATVAIRAALAVDTKEKP